MDLRECKLSQNEVLNRNSPTVDENFIEFAKYCFGEFYHLFTNTFYITICAMENCNSANIDVMILVILMKKSYRKF